MRLKHVFVLILFFSIGLLEIGASPIYLRRLKGTVQHGGGRNAQMYIKADVTTDVIIFNVERCDLQYSILGMNGNVVAYGTKIDIDGEVKVPINEIPYGEYTIKVEFDGIPYMGNFVIEDF